MLKSDDPNADPEDATPETPPPQWYEPLPVPPFNDLPPGTEAPPAAEQASDDDEDAPAP